MAAMLSSGAALRISAATRDFEEITRELGVKATFAAPAHVRKVVEGGEIVEREGPAVWILESTRGEEEALADHLQDFIPYVLRHRDYVDRVKQVAN